LPLAGAITVQVARDPAGGQGRFKLVCPNWRPGAPAFEVLMLPLSGFLDLG
jgi:hypothetical protein